MMTTTTCVHRDVALTQASGGRWGIMSILLSLIIMGIVGLIIRQIPDEEDVLNRVMISWFGAIFALIGVHQGYYGFKRFFQELASRRAGATGKARWQLDYSWQEGGAVYSSTKKLVFEYLKGSLFVFFLAPFVYLVFFLQSDQTDLWVKAVVGFFILGLGLIIYTLRTAWLYHYLYSSSKLSWDQLPLQPGVPFSLELINPRMLERHPSLDISIRYIKEVWVTSGSGDNRRSNIQFQALFDYRQRWEVQDGRLILTACLPADSPTNAMASAESCYWELVVHNDKDLSWHPYLAWFFLPVYSLQEKEHKVLA